MFEALGLLKLLGNKDKLAQEGGAFMAALGGIVGEGSAAGLVTVRVTGRFEVESVTFTDAGAAVADKTVLAGAVAAALTEALASARTQVGAEAQKRAAAVGLPAGLMAGFAGMSG